MKIGNSKNNTIDVDHTSLLDVIFIILMVVMCSVSAGVASSEGEGDALDDAKGQIAFLETELEVNQGYLDAIETIYDDVAIITIYAAYSYTEEEPTELNRELWLSRKTNQAKPLESTKIPVEKDNEQEAIDSLNSQIADLLSSNQNMPVLISIDKERILYRDYKHIDDMLKKLEQEHTNLYHTYKTDNDTTD